MPDDKQLTEYTGPVYRNCPYSDKLLTGDAVCRKDRHPDQGRRAVADQARDLHHQGEPHLRPGVRRHRAGAMAIPRWCMFGAEVTPNHHKLANEFVLLDNLYCNGQVIGRRPSLVARWPTTPTTSPAIGL